MEWGNSLQFRFEASQEITDLEAALAAYQLALAVADSQRTYYDSPGSRQQGVQRHRATTEMAIHLAFDLYKMTQDVTYAEQAFLLAENNKASNLRDHLRSNQALRFSGIPDSLLEKERYFQQRIAALEALNYAEGTDSRQLSEAKELQFHLNQQYRTFLQKIEKDYPRYFQLKYPSQSLNNQDIEQSISTDQALYSYFWGERYLFVFRLFQGKWLADEVVLTKDFEDRFFKWRDFIQNPPDWNIYSPADLSACAYFLKEQLLPEYSPNIRQLLIIPDGRMGYMPFESLLKEKPQSENWKEWAFLLHDYPTIYSYSVSLWLQQQKANQAEKASYVGFAPVFSGGEVADSRMVLGSLQYNQEEVRTTADLLHGKAIVGALAKESTIKNLGNQPTILHFATHALADESDLMRCRLFLDSSEDTGEDGILNAYEIYNLRLNSPLLVLSACQTASGPLQEGEGVMSLARAFQYSGAARVLSTLWNTDDRASGEISKSFFAALKEGIPAETALQQARQQWLAQADNQHAHPYYWANFVLIGDGGTIPIKKPRPWAWVGMVMVGGMLLILLGRSMRK